MKKINCIYVSSNTVKQDIRGQGDKMVNFAINIIAQVILHKHMNIVKYLLNIQKKSFLNSWR